MSLTPEIDKMRAVMSETDTQTVGEFIVWLESHGYTICTLVNEGEECRCGHLMWDAIYRPPQQWLAEMHGIDLAKVDAEKELILTQQRVRNIARDLSRPL